MKRDMELVRKVLLAVEADESVENIDYDTEGDAQQIIMYHVKILADAGFIDADDASGSGFREAYYIPNGLTWEGQEMLDAIRNETVWTQTKEIVKEKGGSIPLQIVTALAIEIAKKRVGL